MPVVAELLTSERLALSRDTYGATPLHKAVLFYQPKLVKLIADKFRIATRAKDQVLAGLLITAFTRTTEMAKSESHHVVNQILLPCFVFNRRAGLRCIILQPFVTAVSFTDIS